MAQVKIDIVVEEGGVVFLPETQSVTSSDNVFWANNDPDGAHQPAPSASQPNAWMPDPIPAKLPGQPAPTSRGLTFGAGTYEIKYVCAKHPEEQGTINVTE
jgi:plastocyanin